MSKVDLVYIVHNVRSAHNVGSILRSADAFGVNTVYFSGYTPYPIQLKDTRLPHLAKKIHAQIAKTALGAEDLVSNEHWPDIFELIGYLRQKGFELAALEQSPRSIDVHDFSPRAKTAIIVGREVEGIEPAILKLVDKIVEIPMVGSKESLNVAVAAAISMYVLRYRR